MNPNPIRSLRFLVNKNLNPNRKNIIIWTTKNLNPIRSLQLRGIEIEILIQI